MNRKSIFVVCLLIILGATSCDRLPFLPFPQDGDSVVLTQTGTGESTQTVDAVMAPAITKSPPSLKASETAATAAILGTATAPLPCNAAAAGRPIDVTIPDDTIIPAGSSFTKIWRLVNIGSCAWTRDYSVVWFSGDQMAPSLALKLPHEVQSGQSIDISVDMSAPEEIGVRQSYWKLRNEESELFGIGPAGDSPFWVRIIVEDLSTPVPTLIPAPTATSVSLIQGSLDLLVGEGLNLDSGEIVGAGQGDLTLELDISQFVLKPAPGALIGHAGSANPSQADCRQVAQGAEPLAVTDEMVGAYYCYLTDQGLPGVARLMAVTPDGIRLDFLTWAIP